MKKTLILCLTVVTQANHLPRRFPDNFMFGASTAAYQIEGGWNADGRSQSIWDYETHDNPNIILDRSNGDIAADTYHQYKRDVTMMRELGLTSYRFSLSWPRILPNGLPNKINQAGVQFYNNYINLMLKYGITPIITLYHWDLPQNLQEMGGFMNPLIADWFEDYARIAFGLFGDRVKHWITFNEPRQICYQGYGSDSLAPMLNRTDVGTYICAKNLVMAHARAYNMYSKFKRYQGGICGITYSVSWVETDSNSAEDRYAAMILMQGQTEIYVNPIFSKEGGFPKEFSERVAEKSAKQGYLRSRLPAFTEEEKAYVRGTYDFMGVNHYTAVITSATKYRTRNVVPSLADDIEYGYTLREDVPHAASVWLRLVPRSMANTLIYIARKYNNPTIYITETGWSTYPSAGLLDDDRIRYYRASLNDVLDAMAYGVDVRGYMAWSLMDNFEWRRGYSECFGLYQVDFHDPKRTRTARKSAFVYKQVIKTRVVDPYYEPWNLTMSIDEK